MSYAARADMEARFGADEINALTGDTDVRLEAALADADAMIDAALVPAYDLPLPDCPLLTAIAADLARARLYDEEPPKQVLGAASAARGQLKKIAEGKVSLVSIIREAVPRRIRTISAAPAAGPVARALGACTVTGTGRAGP